MEAHDGLRASMGAIGMILLAYGMPGAGKSTLLHDMVKAQASVMRFFVLDHEAGWGPEGAHWRGNPPPVTLVQGEDELKRLEEIPTEEFPPTGVFVFRNVEASDVASLAVAKGDTTYVDDEIDLVGRRKGWETSPLRAIVHQGRHCLDEEGEPRVLHIMGACRRPQNLHTDLTDLVDQVFIFRVHGSRTLKRLLDDALIEDAQWPVVRELPNFHFMHWPSGKTLSVAPIGTKNEDMSKKTSHVPV
jgi:hypothetical protein